MPRKSRTVKITPTPKKEEKRFKVTRTSSRRSSETGDPEKDGSIWQSRIHKTLWMRQNIDNGDKHWAAYMSWFNGDQWLENAGRGGWELHSDTIRALYVNNIVQSISSAYIPFLLNGSIEFKAKPRRPEDVDAAKLQTALLNYEWRERAMTEEVKKTIDDVVIIGHGVARTGYVLEVDEAKKKSDGAIEYRDYIKKDAAVVERVNPLDFIHDLSARDGTLKTARWCAERTYYPTADLLANPKYDKQALDMLYSAGDSYSISTRSAYTSGGKPGATTARWLKMQVPEDDLKAVWEIYDKKYMQRILMIEGLPVPLMYEDWPYDYLGSQFPYVMIPFLRSAGLLYPIGVPRQLKDSQLQMNRVRTQQIQNVRAQKNMYGYLVGADGPQKEAIEDFAELPALSAIPMGRPEGIWAIPNPPMNRDALILEQALSADAQRITGADALFQGQPLPDRTTAAEVGVRTNLVRLKADDKISNVEKGVTDIARQVLAHLKAHRDRDAVIEIAGLMGSQWREYTSDAIQAETDVEVSYFAAPKYDPAVERQQRLQVGELAAKLAPAMQQQGAPEAINFAQLFAWMISSFDDVKDAGRFFKPALVIPEPLEEQPAETQPGAGQGLPPALAGQLAPAQIPQQPGAPQPGEGVSQQDLMMQLLSAANQGGRIQ